MVSETVADSVMSGAACVDFSQHAWKKDVCCNCQRPRTEHQSLPESDHHGNSDGGGGGESGGTDSPKPAKRNSVMAKSWIKDESEEDQWNSMCIPDPDQPNKRLSDKDENLIKPSQTNKQPVQTGKQPVQTNIKPPVQLNKQPGFHEHCYEDIDADDMKLGQGQSSSAKGQSSIVKGQGHDYVNTKGDTTVTVTNNKTAISINPEDRLNTLIKENPPVLPGNSLGQRSRSSSREKSPVPAPKPKILVKAHSESDKKTKESMQNENSDSKSKKGQRTISFVEHDPSVIGDDGGLDNLYSDAEDEDQDINTPRESIKLSETEKEWALQALKNTLWNSETHLNEGGKVTNISKEFEDIRKVDAVSSEKLTTDGDSESHNFGTFPLKKKSEKNAMDHLFSSNRLSTLSESSENVPSDLEEKYESVLKFLGAEKIDFHSSPKHSSAINVDGGADDFDGEAYDDPWEDKFAFDNQSEMNLLDEIKGEIDLDSSTAGFALVDLLNDVLAKYSTGTPSETDSVKNLDLLEERLEKSEKGEKRDSNEKSAQIEAKIVTLAANLRKHRAKGRAPRPPSCPPQPPADASSMSPAKQAEIRAAQSKEPTFKMVPLGKSIGPNIIDAAQASSAQSTSKLDISSTSSSNSSDNNDNRSKNDKQAKKGGGGIGGFFSRIFGRGKEAENDITASSETLVSMADPYLEAEQNNDGQGSEKGDNSKEGKRGSKPSPQMKLKVLPPPANRPVSPRPTEKPPLQPPKRESDTDSLSSAVESPKLEVKSKSKHNVKAEKSETNASQKNTAVEVPKAQLSPSKGDNKDQTRAISPKTKEAPPLPLNPPREVTDPSGAPKPRARGNAEAGPPRSRPRKRDSFDGKPRDTPNVPPPKPPVAVKPKAPVGQTKSLDNTDKPAPAKERLPSTSSLEENAKPDTAKKPEKSNDPKVLRKRAKSPKRFAAPIAPGRSSLPNVLTDSNVSLASTTSEVSVQSLPAGQSEHKPDIPKNLSFAKELEQKLNKEQGTTEVRKPPPAPPTTAPKIDTLEKSKSLPVDKNKTIQPVDKSKSLPTDVKQAQVKDKDLNQASNSPKEIARKRSNSKDDLKTSPPTLTMGEDKSKTLPVMSSSSSTELDLAQPSTLSSAASSAASSSATPSDVQIQPEKIELPKATGNSRKSFLGKLNRNKHKLPPPPSVKRTKSVTESTILAEHGAKKIDLKDISGPVLIQDMTSKVVNRRNTITISGAATGASDDNSFLSGGSTSSGSTSAGEKCELSPHGSVENLYEFIKSEAPLPPGKKNLYDPVVESSAVVGLRPPSMTGSEGYLEPVRSNQIQQQTEPVNSNMAESTMSMGSMTTSFVAATSNLGEMMKSTNEKVENPYGDQGLDDLDISDERRELLLNQPIYEEITNGYGKLGALEGENKVEPIPEDIYGVNDIPTAFDPVTSNNEPMTLTSGASVKKKDSFSSDSEMSSASGSLSRPRPIPRKRPRPIGSGFEQYVAMNKPNVAVFLNEEQLRDMLSKLTAMNLTTIKEIYTQHEKCFTKENLHLGQVGPLKWHDFDIYGKPIHASEKSVVYNAKMRTTMLPCQVMLLHSRPEITAANHPSLLKPTSIFTDSVPFTYLTEEFIKTSQILETTGVNQSNSVAKCYIVVGLFDITESLNHHMNSMETICENQKDFLRKVLFFVLQLLSAISHCMDEGHSLSEADFHDLFLISNPYCLGETVSFLPQVRSPDDQRIDRVCLFLENFLRDMCGKCDANAVLDDSAFYVYTGIQKMLEMLQSRVVESLPLVRSYTEFLLWGPSETEPELQDNRHSNLEPKLSMWLEKRRAELIHDFAKRVQHGARCNIKDFYMMKFLLKASSASLAECIRCHLSSTGQQ